MRSIYDPIFLYVLIQKLKRRFRQIQEKIHHAKNMKLNKHRILRKQTYDIVYPEYTKL